MYKKSTAFMVVGAFAVAAIAVGATSIIASDGEDGEDGEEVPSPPGTPYNGPEADVVEESPGNPLVEAVATSGSYDETVLTKFIPGSAFIPLTSGLDTLTYTNPGLCAVPGSNSNGSATVAYAGVELPDGARINQLRAFGSDSNAANMTIQLRRENFRVPILVGPPTRTSETVDDFSTSPASGSFVINGAANLNEVVGSFTSGPGGIITTGFNHRFHTVRVTMTNAAAASGHTLCGVEVLYQVPAADKEAGTVFFPIDPVRAYDSRNSGFAVSGVLAPGQSRTIPVKDGHTDSTVTTPDAVPAGATAVTYNITATGLTGPNFAAVTPGDASGFTTSALNWNGTADIANAGTVNIDGDRQITVWAGDQAGSFQFIIDITGYYAPPIDSHPNMGN